VVADNSRTSTILLGVKPLRRRTQYHLEELAKAESAWESSWSKWIIYSCIFHHVVQWIVSMLGTAVICTLDKYSKNTGFHSITKLSYFFNQTWISNPECHTHWMGEIVPSTVHPFLGRQRSHQRMVFAGRSMATLLETSGHTCSIILWVTILAWVKSLTSSSGNFLPWDCA